MIPIHIHKIIISISQDYSRILNENHTAILIASELDLLTQNSIENIFDPWLSSLYDMVILSRKVNAEEPGNHIATLMSRALDLWTQISIKNIFIS